MIVAVLAVLLGSGAQATATYSGRGADLIAGRTAGPVVAARTYDAARRPVVSSAISADRVRFGEQVAWAPRGLRESISRIDQNRAGLAFSYDPAARLTSAERVAGTQSRTFRDLPGRHGFGYDHADNLLSQQAELECATDAVGTPLDGSGRNRPGSVGGVALSWNRAGQLADRGSLHFGYDASGRLISAKTGSAPRPENGADAAGWVGVASYTVDVLGRRVLEQRDGGTIERVWSGWQEIERYDSDGQLQERRTYGLGLDEVVSLELKVGGTLEEYVPIYGSSGHLAMVVRASTGVPVEAYEYSPYGERSVYVNDLSGPAIEQVRVRPDAIWLELSEEVRLEDLADAITLENLTLGGQELPVEISQPVLEGRNAGRRVAVWADLPDNAPEGQPTWPPRPGEQIRLVAEGSGLIDVWGNVGAAGEERTWQWAGGDVVLADTAAPRVLRVCVTVDGRIEIELSEPIDAATLGAISVDGQAVGWTVSSTGYVLTSAPLAAGSRALVIGIALEDLVGTALGEQWSGSVDVVEGEPSLAWAAPWPGAVGASSVGNVLGFHGLPHDPVTGLVYARNRDYDPEMGRFIQTDPLGYVDSVSLYQYGLNNPVNFSDPTGEFVPVAVAGAAAVSGGVSVGIGWGVAKLTGQKYDWADAGVDFALGAGTFGLDKWFKGGKIGLAGAKLWGARIGAEAALDIGGEAARNALHGRESSVGGLLRGAVLNFGVGEAGAALGRPAGRWLARSARQVAGLQPADLALRSIADQPELLELWTDTLRQLEGSSRSNVYRTYLGDLSAGALPTNQSQLNERVREAFDYASRRFRERARAAGLDAGDALHHWNYNLGAHSSYAFDARNLFPVRSWQHELIHWLTTSNRSNIWRGPIRNRDSLELGPAMSLLPQD